ncbi:protein transporter tim10, variant 2 [Ascochyta rabiei]|uniref:protein transporter tim10, variant 2 n=1 Tax=Didymella rabiei TaxID=5454 RepID=UPI002204CD67|nr:protein transporter tim10, variant 2 [Ascochyta rabiei]UPX13171.1 protein transporter tim10, variant 2 [Ascochyta rabiei]
MSFLFGGRPQLSSEQKIAAAETEIDMVSDMYSRYAAPPPFPGSPKSFYLPHDTSNVDYRQPRSRPFASPPQVLMLMPRVCTASSSLARRSALTHLTARPISTRASPSASTAVCPSSSKSMSRSARRCRARRRASRVVARACSVEACKKRD